MADENATHSRPDTRDDSKGESAVPSAVKSLIGKLDEKIDSKFNETVSLLSQSSCRRIRSDSDLDASPPRFSSPPRKQRSANSDLDHPDLLIVQDL